MHFILLFILIPFTFASEGLFSIEELKSRPGFRDSYVELNGCGAIRIHASKPYVITALHCVTNGLDAIDPQEVIDLGNHFAFDSINRFADLKGKILKDGSTVLATGSCFTGFDPEVLDAETKAKRILAYECALGDWAILSSPKLKATQCSKVVNTASKKLYALGATKKNINRSIGLQKLNGFVYTNAETFSAAEIVKDSRYVFASLWSKMLPEFESALHEKFVMTDGDVMNGMSGGPVITSDFSLFAVTTTALLPTNLWKFEGAFSFEEGFNFGIHGSIKVSHIMDQIQSQGLESGNYFSCP